MIKKIEIENFRSNEELAEMYRKFNDNLELISSKMNEIIDKLNEQENGE